MDIYSAYGYMCCGKCFRIKSIPFESNLLKIPNTLLKKHGFADSLIFLEDTKEGLLIRKATEEEIKLVKK